MHNALWELARIGGSLEGVIAILLVKEKIMNWKVVYSHD
ncbi:hypothetical protein FHS15_002158 [Paenibacillus castaneae]|nr:hypothetical protein [Paenibacillus castaneae]